MATTNPLQQILDASRRVEAGAVKQKDQLTQLLTQMGVLRDESIAATDKETAATNVIDQQALTGAQQAQDDARAFATSVGALGSDPATLLVQLGKDLNAQLAASKAARDNIVAKQSINPIDNPLGFLHGQFTIEADAQAYSTAQQAAKDISADITTATATVDAFARTQAAHAVKVTDATKLAAAEAREAQAAQAKIDATRNFSRDELAISAAIQNADAQQVTEAQRRLGVAVDAERLGMERQRFQLAQQQFAWEKEYAKIQREREAVRQAREDARFARDDAKLARADQKEASQEAVRTQLLRQYNTGAATMGYAQETNFDLLMARRELGGTEAAKIDAAMSAGGNSLSSGARRVASTPGQAAQIITSGLFPKGEEPGFKDMKKLLTEQWNSALVTAKGRTEIAIKSVNLNLDTAVAKFNKDAFAPGSFYEPPALSRLTSTKAVQSTKFYKKVLRTAGKDLTESDPDVILDLAGAAVAEGELTPEEAANGVRVLYSQAASINNAEKKFAQVGIPAQLSVGYLDGATSIDLTDPTQVTHAMARRRAQKTLKNLSLFPVFGGPLSTVLGGTDE